MQLALSIPGQLAPHQDNPEGQKHEQVSCWASCKSQRRPCGCLCLWNAKYHNMSTWFGWNHLMKRAWDVQVMGTSQQSTRAKIPGVLVEPLRTASKTLGVANMKNSLPKILPKLRSKQLELISKRQRGWPLKFNPADPESNPQQNGGIPDFFFPGWSKRWLTFFFH